MADPQAMVNNRPGGNRGDIKSAGGESHREDEFVSVAKRNTPMSVRRPLARAQYLAELLQFALCKELGL